MPLHEDRDEFFFRPQSSKPGYAVGSAPEPGPAGTVYVPELGTYVDSDVADNVGVTINRPIPTAHSERRTDPSEFPFPVKENTPEEIPEDNPAPERARQAVQLDSPSETLNEVATHFSASEFEEGVERMIEGDFEDTIDRLSDATGLDHTAAASVIQVAIEDVAPLAQEHLVPGAWDALVYAASRTEDPLARRIVAGFVQGKLPANNLSKAYALWYDSLPDAED